MPSSFEETMLPHLPTAYNLARWLLRNEHDAEDSVQDAYLRAYRVFERFRGGDGRAWLLTIVRNVCYDRLRRLRGAEPLEPFDETQHTSIESAVGPVEPARQEINAEQLRVALDALPEKMREVIVLHEIEGLAYREIAEVIGVPIGTVMSRLSRARERLQQDVLNRVAKSSSHEL